MVLRWRASRAGAPLLEFLNPITIISMTYPPNTYLFFSDISEHIISVTALDQRSGWLFGVDLAMNFLRSTDDGVSWKKISSKHFYDIKNETFLKLSTGIHENMVSASPETFWSAATFRGRKWGG